MDETFTIQKTSEGEFYFLEDGKKFFIGQEEDIVNMEAQETTFNLSTGAVEPLALEKTERRFMVGEDYVLPTLEEW
jgi:hypothetical protein